MRILVAAFVGIVVLQGQTSRPLEPFKGVTVDGTVAPGLFAIRSTGVSTKPVKDAADRFLASLTHEQRTKTMFDADADEWRVWNNIHRAPREGLSFKEMSQPQREAAYGMLGASLSARGLEQSKNVMRLNGHLAELLKNFDEYGEYLYWITVMGTPSATEPWGWQLDGHHLAMNYFVMGDQVVMTPSFMGSEPVVADSGPYKGTSVLQEEQAMGEAFMSSLDATQRAKAIVAASKPANNAQTQAYRDNVTLPYQGIRATALTPAQRDKLVALVALYVGNMRDGHATVKMSEVERHLGDTYFSWVGGTGPDAVFYYRIHSPVILIEFDHQTPVALAGRGGPPTRRHVHSVVRTPNGNDYGKDLLRQHYEKHKHDKTHGPAQQPALPQAVEGDFVIRDFRFQSGETLPELRQHYRTLGRLRKDAQGRATNAVLIVHGTTGSGAQFGGRAFAGELFLPGQPLDITKYFIVMPDAIGHGASSKPSDRLRAKFPRYGYADMVDAQHRLLTEGLGVNHARLVMGTSMGGMHTWVWGQRYPGFMDALMPLASLPAQISGRNRAWRRVLIDAIRDDPEWNGGNYTAQPQSMRTAAQMLWLVSSNPVLRQNAAPTLAATDKVLDDYARGYRGDANDVLYAVEASRDYDPAPGLEKIRAPLMAINFADDLINPPELGIFERETTRVPNGCAITVPAGERTTGHGTHTLAAVWKHHLVELLRVSERPGAAVSCR